MPWTQEELLNRLMELGIDAPTVQHRPIFTVKEGEKILEDLQGGRCKSLFLKDKKGALWLAVINETAKAVQVVLQRRMMAMDLLNYHPLRNDATTTISPIDLLKFLAAVGHGPIIIDL